MISGRFCTLDGVTVKSVRDASVLQGHNGILLDAGGGDNLVKNFNMQAVYMHTISVRNTAGNVFMDGKGIDIDLDCAAHAPYANLFTNIDLGKGLHIWQGSGGPGQGKSSASWNVFWNIRAEKSVDFLPAQYGSSLISLIGCNSSESAIKEKDGKWFEPITPSKIFPQNLFQAQFNLRSNSLKIEKKVAAKLNNPITPAYLKQHLSKSSPKLMLTPELVDLIQRKVKTDTLTRNYFNYLKNEADILLQDSLPKYKMTGFRMQVSHFIPRRLQILSMVYTVNKDPKLLKRINEELLAICNFPDWNPQHYLDVAQTAMGVSIAIDWLKNDLPKSTIALAKQSLIDKAILPSFNPDGDKLGWRMGWIEGNNNWNAVCHGGMIIAALAVADINPDLAAKTITRALDKLPNSLVTYAPDGVYPEGPGYWKFGTNYTVAAAETLKTALGSDFGITQSQGFLKSAEFRLLTTAPSGQCFNFSDSDGILDGETSVLLAYFAVASGNGIFLNRPYFNNPLPTENVTRIRRAEDLTDPGDIGRLAGIGLLWLSEAKQQKITPMPLVWRGNGIDPVAIFRSDDAKTNSHLYLATKGGNATVSHANMDDGSFIFELNGVRWAIDPGNQNYYDLNKINFPLSDYSQNSLRWDLLTKGNEFHNTVTINNSHHKVNGYVPITDIVAGDKPEIVLDMTALYGDNIKSFFRKFSKDSDQSVIVEDKFDLNANTKEITWQMMTVANVELTDKGAKLKQDGKTLNLEIVEPANLHFSIVSLDPAPQVFDKQINNLKRLEIRVPAYIFKSSLGFIKVKLSSTE